MIEKIVNNFPIEKTFSSEFLLRLGDGQVWALAAAKGTGSEVKQLGRLMRLKRPCQREDHSKLVFMRNGWGKGKFEKNTLGVDEDMEGYLIQLGWKAHPLNSIRLWSHNSVPDVVCEFRHQEGVHEQSILSMRLSLLPIYQGAEQLGGLPLHSALVKFKDVGVMLAAPKKTGKSTCCRRLPSPWQVLCDEETLIVRDCRKQYAAHPFPTWSYYAAGDAKKTWNTQNHIPVAGVFFLEQSDKNQVSLLGQGEAAAFINQTATQVCHRFWNNLPDDEVIARKKRVFKNASELARAIPTFKLGVSLQGRFWEQIEKVLF
jgi:SynChlorMet cassette protein ScmC